MALLDLILNLSLLVSLSIVSGFVEKRWPRRKTAGVLLQGLLFGGVAVLGMLRPLTLGPGLIFDGRSVMVSLCALFFGPLAAAAACTLTIACRIALGGIGTVTGALVILSSAAIGLVAHVNLRPHEKSLSAWRLYLFGLSVHVAMLALMFTLPGAAGLKVVMKIGLPIILLYPLATILAGKILVDQVETERMISKLRENEQRLNATHRIAKLGNFTWNVKTGEVTWSDTLYEMLKYDKSEIIDFAKVNERIHHPDDLERVTRWLNDCVASGQGVLTPNQYRLLRKDGETLHVRITGIIEPGEGKAPTVFATLQDITDQVNTRRELEETEAILKAAMDCSTAGIAIADAPDGTLRYVNDAGLNIRGRVKEEVVDGVGAKQYAESWQILHFDGTPYAEDDIPLARAVKYGERCDRRFIIRRPDEDRVVWATAAPVINKDGDVNAGIVVFTDITELKHAESKIEWNARRNELLSQIAAGLLQSDDPLHLVDDICRKVMTFLDCHAFFNFLADSKTGRLRLNACAGIPDDEARDIEWIDYGVAVCGCVARDRRRIIAEDIFNAASPETELVKSYGIQADCCHPLMVRDRLLGTLSFGTRSRPRFSDREIETMKAVTDLVTVAVNRIETETALRESEAKYRAIMQSMVDPTYICSPDFGIEYMNPAMIEMIGRDAVNERCHEAIHERDEKCAWCNRRKIMKGEAITFEIEDTRREKDFLVSHSPIFHADGTVSTLTVLRDVTETKRMETRLQQAQKMEAIGTLAGGIAHDFNNILSPIIGYTEMMQDDLPPDPALRRSAEEIYQAALRARSLVQQILTFSRQAKEEILPIQLQPIVKEALKLLRSTMPTTIDIRHDIDPNCGVVLADPTRFHQILMNLATNAYHAMENTGGELKVSLKQIRIESEPAVFPNLTTGDYALLKVADTGVGIEKQVMERIFDPYFTTKENGKGTGLGLSIVQGIVKNCNGDIRIYSEPGQGTEVHVYLPIKEKEETEYRMETQTVLPVGTEKILLADDEDPVARMQKLLIERLGYTVVARTGSIEALEAFRADPHEIDLVITDMTMPDMTGDRLTAELRKIRPDIPVIVCTGFSEQVTEAKYKAMGFQGYLMKPMIKSEIAAMIRRVLDEN